MHLFFQLPFCSQIDLINFLNKIPRFTYFQITRKYLNFPFYDWLILVYGH